MQELTEHQRDERDLMVLDLLANGQPQAEVARYMGCTRGSFQRLIKENRDGAAIEKREEARGLEHAD
ncbi:helix-turn-helix domain-containing protein [Pseudophaeobacter sp.]|uniref:helix-turn-helix domain-containing protein n=1 Tax=Pseudophaeobacter sp. TaxID=1971739 RepID=UPI003A97D8B8